MPRRIRERIRIMTLKKITCLRRRRFASRLLKRSLPEVLRPVPARLLREEGRDEWERRSAMLYSFQVFPAGSAVEKDVIIIHTNQTFVKEAILCYNNGVRMLIIFRKG